MRPIVVVDLYCGKGGWSKPFLEDGDEVWGIDIKDHGYPGRLIVGDIREIDGFSWAGIELVIGSPPCDQFSLAKGIWSGVHSGKYRGRKRNLTLGLTLIDEFHRFVAQAKPKYWAFENVAHLLKWYPRPPIWRFKISRGGRRCLWGRLPLGLNPELKFRKSMVHIGVEKGRPFNEWAALRAEIPYPIARFVADQVKASL